MGGCCSLSMYGSWGSSHVEWSYNWLRVESKVLHPWRDDLMVVVEVVRGRREWK
jgi:hypothetical protein